MITSETRERMRQAKLGIKLSDATKRKMSLAKKGKTPQNLDWLHQTFRAEKHPFWKGDDVSYSGIHKWINKQRNKTGICSYCEIKSRTDWANISKKYQRKIDDWLELCRGCHIIYDNRKRNNKGQYT